MGAKKSVPKDARNIEVIASGGYFVDPMFHETLLEWAALPVHDKTKAEPKRRRPRKKRTKALPVVETGGRRAISLEKL